MHSASYRAKQMQNRSLTPSPVSGSSEIPKFSSPFTQRKGYRESSATICSRTSPLTDRVLAVLLVSSSLNGREQVEGHNPSNVCCCSQNLFIFGLSLVGYVLLCVRLTIFLLHPSKVFAPIRPPSTWHFFFVPRRASPSSCKLAPTSSRRRDFGIPLSTPHAYASEANKALERNRQNPACCLDQSS